MGHGNAIEDIKVDLRASLIKPLHANWVISAISVLAERTDTLKKPFEKKLELWYKILMTQ